MAENSQALPSNVHVVDHPLVQHKLTLLRDQNTSSAQFRALAHEMSALMAYEAARDLPTATKRIATPLAEMDAPIIEGKKLALIAVLRAGIGILDGVLQVLPQARVGFVGLFRDPQTLQAVEYYFKLPPNMPDRDAWVVDPMLATGHSAVSALDAVKKTQPRSIKFLCLLAAPEGVKHVAEHHPDVPIYTASVDSHLNDKAYIVPGLGDAGDRLFGTK